METSKDLMLKINEGLYTMSDNSILEYIVDTWKLNERIIQNLWNFESNELYVVHKLISSIEHDITHSKMRLLLGNNIYHKVIETPQMMANTCTMINGEIAIYPCDIKNAINGLLGNYTYFD